MTGTFITSTDTDLQTSAPVAAQVVRREQRPTRRITTRPWSAIICGQPEDNTLLLVDWLLLACRAAGFVAHAVPLLGDAHHPYGMYLEVAADADGEASFGGTPWGAVDLVVAGEHLELVRAIAAGYVDAQSTTVISSCRRDFTAVERNVAPQHVLREREIDELATASARAYHAFDGPEVAGWYGLPASAQAGLLFGAVLGSGVTSLDVRDARAAIEQLGIDAALHSEALRRGTRLGRRTGGRIRRPRTAYQFTRRRRIVVDHASRAAFEALVARCDEVVDAAHVPALQDAIFLLCQFQDASWATRMVDHVADVAAEERQLQGDAWRTETSVVPDTIRSLTSLMTWADPAWIANRKLRAGRFKELRAAHGITRADQYSLVEHIPLDAVDRVEIKHPRLRSTAKADPSVPSLLQSVRIERISPTTVSGIRQLRRMAASAKWRNGSVRQRREIDTAETWLSALRDALRADHGLAQIVARSGTLVQGSGAVRDANRATAEAFWGRIVRQSISLDRSVGTSRDGLPARSIARIVVPFVWQELARSGPLALWEYATPVVRIAMARSRGMSHDDAVDAVEALCS